MTLKSSLNAARSSLIALGTQAALVARNVAGVGEPNSSRKLANLGTLDGGGVVVMSISRVADQALFSRSLEANAASSGSAATAMYASRLFETVGDPDSESSPAAAVGRLTEALRTYATGPQDPLRASAFVATADDTASVIRSAAEEVAGVRRDADREMLDTVTRIGTLLSRFEEANNAVIRGQGSPSDLTDQLDNRDRILNELSAEIGIRTVTRANNDVAIYTDSGVTLFDVIPRTVTMARDPLPPTSPGATVYADGVAITGSGAPMAVRTGRLAGLAEVRDNLALTYQAQLDEVARGLIETFAETDRSATPTLPAEAGLFTDAGALTLPPTGTQVPGLALRLTLNAAADPRQGGTPQLVRDGGMNGNPAYRWNTANLPAYGGRIQNLIDQLNAQRDFDPGAQALARGTVAAFASSSAGWLGEARRTATGNAEVAEAFSARATDALSRATGVDLDTEMSNMLNLERSYEASAQLIRTIDQMYQALLNAVR
jgi:flagellar hook-associated protein 1 FlgK